MASLWRRWVDAGFYSTFLQYLEEHDMDYQATAQFIILLALIQYFFFAIGVGRARETCGVPAPATSGHPEFVRRFRVQQNTLLFSAWVSAGWACLLGILFLIGRWQYSRGYVADPAGRGRGFMIGAVAQILLLLGSLLGGLGAIFG
jgi:glutathione S-transferase